jgi:hypothetical protein
VAGNYAYVANGDSGFRVISVSDPANPTEVGYCGTPSRAEGVAVDGDYAYVADLAAGLRVISVSDPANPVEVGSCETPGNAEGVTVVEDYAYVADVGAGLRVISVADPANPIEVGYYDTPRSACDLAVADDYVYVAHGDAGLRIHQFYGEVGVEEARRPTRCGSQSSPAIVRGVLFLPPSSSVERGASSVLLDAAGRRVVVLHAGANDVSRLAPGVYFVRGVQAQEQVVRKVIVTR